jgi:CHASE3 domain sensor protein
VPARPDRLAQAVEKENTMNRNGGVGIVGVIIIVLVILWLLKVI